MIRLNDINLSKIDLSGIDLRGIMLGLGGRGGSGDDSQRPWLFPDQAWTVAGKTNEDSDRATIANITGNGNNLMLTNFGFVEGSGYNQEGEYAGYLVTDGVDDIVTSKEKVKLQRYFTLVGDWQFIIKEDKNSGVIVHGKLYCYNRINGILVYVNNSSINNNLENVIKIRALSSDGKVYDENWNEIQIKTGDVDYSYEHIQIGGHSQQSKYTRVAFKNIAIYNNILSKDDCIKAYDYLQTLKAK